MTISDTEETEEVELTEEEIGVVHPFNDELSQKLGEYMQGTEYDERSMEGFIDFLMGIDTEAPE